MNGTAKPGGKRAPRATEWLSLIAGGAVRLYRRPAGAWVLVAMGPDGAQLHLDLDPDDVAQLRELLAQATA